MCENNGTYTAFGNLSYPCVDDDDCCGEILYYMNYINKKELKQIYLCNVITLSQHIRRKRTLNVCLSVVSFSSNCHHTLHNNVFFYGRVTNHLIIKFLSISE